MFKLKIQPVQSNNSDLLALDSKKRTTTSMRFSQYLRAYATTTATATRTPKKQDVYISKTKTLQVHHALLYISLSSLHDHNVKKKNSHFVEDGNTRQRLSFPFPELCYSPLEHNRPKHFANICRIKRDGISVIQFEAARIHFLSEDFLAVAVLVALAPY